MAETVICPHCKGTGVNYIILQQEGTPSIQSVSCAVCDGKGNVPMPEPEPEKAASPRRSPEMWPILVPLGLFSLFFAYLWL
jgi:hypothetical protein